MENRADFFLPFIHSSAYLQSIIAEAVDVKVSIVVSNIRAVSEVTMDYNLEMFYRESWFDKRLAYNSSDFQNKTEIALHESYTNSIWHPDTFMPNAIASKNPQKQSISHRSLLRLDVKGNILYSRRISIVAECPMDLTLFPFDSQVCKLGIESYGYTADQVRYTWSSGTKKALALSRINLPDFHIKEAYVTSQLEEYATGNYSRLYVCFVFSRAAGFCFLQLIIPSTAIVITSWVSLWMENETSFQDMISIILTITFLLFSYNEVMPRVSYIKAMDVYLGVCFCTVFFSLIKLAFVKSMRQRLKNSNTLMDGFPSSPCYVSKNYLINNDRPPSPCNAIRSPCRFYRNSLIDPRIETKVLLDPALPRAIAIGEDWSGYRPQQITLFSINRWERWTSVYEKLDTTEDLMMLSDRAICGRSSSLGGIQFSETFLVRFHWISQLVFFFGFVTFGVAYFLVVPNLQSTVVDPACAKELAIWYAKTST
ncbi:hypothetical protein AB6A40_007517 [Gnathostoma spinigerum]|uniref:Uncharacterized protein n=1 Tax=Gnathostoma spinigerum TaxID=75299 RepID=A0ABD6ELQ5_9BILA